MRESQSNLDLDAIEQRAKEATKGPWVPDHEYQSHNVFSRSALPSKFWLDTDSWADAEFIAHARQDVPALVARVRELEDLVRPFIGMEDPDALVDYGSTIGEAATALGIVAGKRMQSEENK